MKLISSNLSLSTNKLFNIVLFLVSLLGFAFLNLGNVSAASIEVQSGNDGMADNAICQLSEALQNINDQAQTYGDCAAGDGNDDTILLPEGRITLTQDLPTVSGRSITVKGAGADKSIIDGAGQYRGITISDPQVGALVEDFIIDNIKGSHAIAVTGVSQNVIIRQIEARNIVFENAIIFVTGSYETPHETDFLMEDVYIHDSMIDVTYTSGGPATAMFMQFIYPVESTVRRTTIANNQIAAGFTLSLAESDGLVLQNSSLAFENNTVALNESVTYDGSMSGIFLPIFASGYGNILANMNIKNNTIVSNVSEISELEGVQLGALGVFALEQGKVIGRVQNNILANNLYGGEKSSCIFFPFQEGVVDIVSLGHNISDDASCETVFTESGDRNDVLTEDLKLQPIVAKGRSPIRLAAFNYDGSFAPVIALGAGSIAIDSGDCSNAPDMDQRFVARPQGNSCDVGSYEAVLAATTDSDGLAGIGGVRQLAETGASVGIAIFIGFAIVTFTIYTYIDYRRHRRPLVQENPKASYSYSHHIKVVTIPVMRYRISVTLQRKNPSQKKLS